MYQLRQSNGKVAALRCWLRDETPPELIARYRALGDPATLKLLTKPQHSPIVTRLAIHADGVVIDPGDGSHVTRPVVVLDWLMGPTMLAAVDRACRARDTTYLSALANAWSAAMAKSAEVGFVHGDLTADNAIVRPKEGIAFVDYDSAYWPGVPSLPSLDPALAYRHPRGLTTRREHADDFAALLVYASLRLLAVWPELRVEHGQPATVRGAGLVFQPRDLAHPDGSPLFGKLRVLNDPTALGLTSILREACLTDPDDIPSFRESLELAGNVAESHPQASRGSRMTSILAGAANVVRETASKGTDRLRHAAQQPMDHSWPERQRNWRPERLAGLLGAIQSRDLVKAEAEWATVKGETGAGALMPALEKLRAEIQPPPPIDFAARHAARENRRRSGIQRQFLNAIDHDDRATLADMALSGELDEVEGLNDASTMRIVGSLAISHLERALETHDDNLIIDSYDEQVLSASGLLTQEQRNRVDLAFDRRQWLEDVRAAIRAHDLAAIDRLYAAMPDGADQMLRDRERRRITRLRTEEDAIAQFTIAVRDGADDEVIAALGGLERTGAILPQDLPWTTISEVIDRHSLVTALKRAADQHPRDMDRIGRLLPQIKQINGGTWPKSAEGLELSRLETEVIWHAQLLRVREAIATDDDRKIVTATLPDVHGVIPMLDRGEQARLERAVAAASRALRRSGHRVSNASSSATVETT